MTENPFGDFYIESADDELVIEERPTEALAQGVGVQHLPGTRVTTSAPSAVFGPEGWWAGSQPEELVTPSHVAVSAPVVAQPVVPVSAAPAAAAVARPVVPVSAASAPAAVAQAPAAAPATREQQLARELDALMDASILIQAVALVSLDGFTMASALPEGMHEERVGAMSAAILGLGERAAAELGRGRLTQVFIEGDGGDVVLVAAGDRAVLTCIADEGAKLGLVLYDMRATAQVIAEILG